MIPEGDYCYTTTGRVRIQNKMFDEDGEEITRSYYFMPETITCPFWKATGNGGAHCSHLNEDSEYMDPSSLVWDQVKSCGENRGEGYNLFELEEMRLEVTPREQATKHAKKYPQFIQSLVAILLDSEDNEFKYDGITYTLSQNIIDSIG